MAIATFRLLVQESYDPSYPSEGRNSLLGLIRGALLPHTISGAIPAGLIRLIEIPSHILLQDGSLSLPRYPQVPKARQRMQGSHPPGRYSHCSVSQLRASPHYSGYFAEGYNRTMRSTAHSTITVSASEEPRPLPPDPDVIPQFSRVPGFARYTVSALCQRPANPGLQAYGTCCDRELNPAPLDS